VPILKYLIAIWVAIVFYALASFTVGAFGMNAYSQLNEQREKQMENVAKLQALNEELSGIKEALRYDNDTIAVYARDLGFGTQDERFIRIVGLDNKHKEALYAGEVVNTESPGYVDDKTLRIISVIIALSLMLCIAVVDILQFVKNA
jgi:cell division protein FtsB